MKRVKFTQMANEDKRKKNQDIQLRIKGFNRADLEVVSEAPPRSIVETGLLLRAIKRTEEDYRKEGKLIKNGRKWKFNI
ncbi:MAG: hypothetical protein ACOY35_11595 [Bacillota bacterium]